MERIAIRLPLAAAALCVSLGMGAATARGQQLAPGTVSLPPLPVGRSPTGPATARAGRPYAVPAGGRASVPVGIRRVQATEGDLSAPAPSTPAPAPPPNPAAEGVPAAESPFGGDEPTEATAEAESAEAPEDGESERDPTRLLMNALGIEDSPIQFYGWIENSFTANPSFPADRINFGVTPNYRSNDWLGNQYYLVAEKPLKTDDTINVGFRLDTLFGHDWQFTKMRGVFDHAWRPGYFPGIDLPQFYGDLHLPVLTEGGLDVRFGRWYTLHGYEVVPAIGRPLLSVPYMFTFGQPFTHWGALTTWHVNDRLVIYNGIPQGWDRFQNEHARWGYMGGFSWTSRNGKFNLTHIYSRNSNQFPKFIVREEVGTPPALVANDAFTSNFLNLWTTVLSYKWTDRLTQVIETDQGLEEGVPGLGPRGLSRFDGNWYSFGNWFLYKIDENDKLMGVWRSEVFWDVDGVRTGFADRFYEMTLGLIYKPKPWLWIRPEARYDWSQFTHPYNAGFSDSQFTYGLDVILLY